MIVRIIDKLSKQLKLITWGINIREIQKRHSILDSSETQVILDSRQRTNTSKRKTTTKKRKKYEQYGPPPQ
jgi:hypothetical protein